MRLILTRGMILKSCSIEVRWAPVCVSVSRTQDSYMLAGDSGDRSFGGFPREDVIPLAWALLQQNLPKVLNPLTLSELPNSKVKDHAEVCLPSSFLPLVYFSDTRFSVVYPSILSTKWVHDQNHKDYDCSRTLYGSPEASLGYQPMEPLAVSVRQGSLVISVSLDSDVQEHIAWRPDLGKDLS